MKKSFLLLEIILVIALFLVLYSFFIPKTNSNKLNLVSERLVYYLKYVRLKALINDKFEEENDYWYMKRWTLKFLNCRSSVGGFYYTIYSDSNMLGHANKSETLKDPLSNKYVYSSNSCVETKSNSKYVLLSKAFDIKNIELSCNTTSSLGQVSFSSNGKIYSKLSRSALNSSDNEITSPCIIKLTDVNDNYREIKIDNSTGFVKLISK